MTVSKRNQTTIIDAIEEHISHEFWVHLKTFNFDAKVEHIESGLYKGWEITVEATTTEDGRRVFYPCVGLGKTKEIALMRLSLSLNAMRQRLDAQRIEGATK